MARAWQDRGDTLAELVEEDGAWLDSRNSAMRLQMVSHALEPRENDFR